MAIGRVVQHDVDHDANAATVGGLDERVEVGERAKLRIDVLVVADVVAEVNLRRGIERRDPERGQAETGEVVEARGNPVQIADAVAVTVLKTANVDFVEDRVGPPASLQRGLLSSANYAAASR
jgi:hypothetical protein